jgi:uncharacterized pyridoxamine 5'-phosphate oxidase family protein
MDDIKPEDINQLYGSSLILYNGAPAYCAGIHDGTNVLLTILGEKPENTIVPFSFDTIKAYKGEIGFINSKDVAIYIERKTMRQYSVGITVANISFHYCAVDGDYVTKLQGGAVWKTFLKTTGFRDCLLNKYPSLKEAFKQAKEGNTLVAFHKKFAVYRDGQIVYKDKVVGKLVGSSVAFNEGSEFLEPILSGNYEKTIRTFKSAPSFRGRGD